MCKNNLKYFLILPSPSFPSFLLDIISLKSFIKFLFKKLVVNFIPDSIKILEKPNSFALISDLFKSRSPSLLVGIL